MAKPKKWNKYKVDIELYDRSGDFIDRFDLGEVISCSYQAALDYTIDQGKECYDNTTRVELVSITRTEEDVSVA